VTKTQQQNAAPTMEQTWLFNYYSSITTTSWQYKHFTNMDPLVSILISMLESFECRMCCCFCPIILDMAGEEVMSLVRYTIDQALHEEACS
jgi:hypothetical protein